MSVSKVSVGALKIIQVLILKPNYLEKLSVIALALLPHLLGKKAKNNYQLIQVVDVSNIDK